jgi:DNA-binding NarL/FixJ family response regulator
MVENNRVFRELLRGLLGSRFPRLEILEAGGLAEGTQQARAHGPAVVFVDISLPDGNGLDLAKRIRDELPGTRVIVCTTYDIPEYREAAARCGAQRFLSKDNLDTEALIAVVEGALGEGGQGWEAPEPGRGDQIPGAQCPPR